MSPDDEKQEQEHEKIGHRPRILQSVEIAESLISLYFEQDPEKPTLTGLALHLGFVSRVSLQDYIDRGDTFSAPIQKAVSRIEQEHEKRLYGAQCVGSIFWLKNKGWKDSHDVTSDGEKLESNISITLPTGATEADGPVQIQVE